MVELPDHSPGFQINSCLQQQADLSQDEPGEQDRNQSSLSKSEDRDVREGCIE
jgi:hypothetical protein